MLNKKKMTIVISIAIVMTICLIAGVIWLTTTTVKESAGPVPTASATSTDTPTAPGFTDKLQSAAVSAAVTAAVFQGSDTRAARVQRYAAAGFTQELAENFEPVWFDVFDIASRYQVETTGETFIGAAVNYTGVNAVQAVSATGKAGNRVYRVTVKVGCTPQWSVDGEGQRMASPFTAPWTITVHEKTGLITGIEQPTGDDMPFHPEG